MKRTGARLMGIGLAALLGLCAGAPVAASASPLEILDSVGNPDVQAGSHPDRMITRLAAPETNGVQENTRDQIIEFPPGMGGDPHSVPLCPRPVFDNAGTPFEELPCPVESQVGALVIVRENLNEVTPVKEVIPVYALKPAPGEIAAFGIALGGVRLKFSGHLRAADLGLSMKLEGLPQVQPEDVGATLESYFEFWGIPADHQTGTTIPRRPFLTLPTKCGAPLEIGIRERTWQRSGEWRQSTASTGLPLTGCGVLPFAPTVALGLENPVTDTPSGVDLDLSFAQPDDPDAPASSQVRGTRIELPAGVGISLGAAAGIKACTDAQLHLGSEEPATCPAAAKVGTTEFEAPQLDEALVGTVYLGEEHPGDRFRVFVVVRSGEVEGKFVGSMSPNPATGRLTTILSEMPQIPLSRLRMHFDGGSRALLVMPSQCGPATATATATPYSGTPAVTTSASVAIGARPGRACGTPAPFEPSLAVATSNPRGGKPTSFSAVIGRRDGEQSAERFSFQFPSGMSASLGSVTPCSDAAVAAATCPAASKIGGAFIDLGTGPETTELSGDAYLTGPYKKGPFGFALIFHLDVGPFHLGTLAVRAAMELNPLTGQVTSQSDRLPQSFEGIPISFQRLGLEIDRPGFLSNPTSCTPKRVGATLESTAGTLAHPSAEFFLRDCVALGFHPSFSVALTGASELERGGHPGMRVSMRSRKGEANIRSTELQLPPGFRFSSANLREICPRAEAVKGACPKRSQVGTSFGRTPLLGKPLKGAVYVVQPPGDGDPDLWANLKGQGVELNIRSQSQTKNGRVDTQYKELPDMPLSRFTMQFTGGKHGFLVLDRSLCAHGRPRSLTAPASFEAQNGAYRRMRLSLVTPKSCKTG